MSSRARPSSGSRNATFIGNRVQRKEARGQKTNCLTQIVTVRRSMTHKYCYSKRVRHDDASDGTRVRRRPATPLSGRQEMGEGEDRGRILFGHEHAPEGRPEAP